MKETKIAELDNAISEIDSKFYKACKKHGDDCTIIIPTKNRPVLYNRLMDYYNKRKIDNPILVADSTGYSHANKYENLNNIIIIGYNSDVSMFDKLADVGKRVKTKYCVVSADDDFLMLQSIDRCIEFLEKNLDFAVAMGQTYEIPDNSKSDVIPGKILSSVIATSQNKRFFYHFSDYMVTAYGVYRTESFNYVWKETQKYKNKGVWAELFASALTSAMGNIMVFNFPYIVRSSQDVTDSRSAKGIYDYVANGSYSWRYKNFRNGLIDNGLDGNVIDKGWKKYTKHYHGFIKDRFAYLVKICCFRETDGKERLNEKD